MEPTNALLAQVDWAKLPWAYASAMVLAIVAFLVVLACQPKTDFDRRLTLQQKLFLMAAAFVGGSLGGKLPFVLASERWLVPEVWFMDGKTLTTGLVGAYVAVEFAKTLLGITIKTGDRYAMPLAAALMVGRWGCFFNGCCYGIETDLPWALEFASAPGERHPTQLYESLFHGTMLFVLFVATLQHRWLNHRLQIYLLAYCGYRFLTEWIRPEPHVLLGLTFYQWMVASFALLLGLQWYFESRWARREAAVVDSA